MPGYAEEKTVGDNAQHQQGNHRIQPVFFQPETDHGEQYPGNGCCDQRHYTKLHNGFAVAMPQGLPENGKTKYCVFIKSAVVGRLAAILKKVHQQAGDHDRHSDDNAQAQQVTDEGLEIFILEGFHWCKSSKSFPVKERICGLL